MKLVTQRGHAKEYRDLESGKEFFSISQIRNEMLPPHRGDQAALDRGNALHLRFALALGAKAGIGDYPPVLAAYPNHCRHMDAWIAEYDCEAVRIEEPSVNEQWGYAGTPENRLRVPFGPRAFQFGIIDLKTGSPTKTDGIQLTLCKMLAGYEDVSYLADLYLDEHGTRLVERPYNPFDFACAMAALQVLKWRHAN